jgi:hypothetical protein
MSGSSFHRYSLETLLGGMILAAVITALGGVSAVAQNSQVSGQIRDTTQAVVRSEGHSDPNGNRGSPGIGIWVRRLLLISCPATGTLRAQGREGWF